MAFGLSPKFNEPESNDTTSAPAEPSVKIVQALTQKKKKKLVRDPSTLASAISRAKRAKPSSYKFGG